jgi:hypothetical protein
MTDNHIDNLAPAKGACVGLVITMAVGCLATMAVLFLFGYVGR